MVRVYHQSVNQDGSFERKYFLQEFETMEIARKEVEKIARGILEFFKTTEKYELVDMNGNTTVNLTFQN